MKRTDHGGDDGDGGDGVLEAVGELDDGVGVDGREGQ
jgi:hypothetical protein